MTRAPKLEVVEDIDALRVVVARTLATAVDAAIAGRGRCHLALSRPTPEPVFDGLTLPWGDVDVWQVDERVALPGDEARNLTLLARTMPDAHIRPMPVDEDPAAGARRYADELVAACGDPPVLDVVHLGLGTDGHTASLLPGDPVLDERARAVAVAGPSGGYARLTLTYPVLERARLVVMVVAGAAKADALARVMAGEPGVPAARVGSLVILADAEAAAGAG